MGFIDLMCNWHHLFGNDCRPNNRSMKKVIMMLLVLGTFIGVKAQSSKDEARRVVLGQPKNSREQTKTVILGRNGEPNQTRRVYETKQNRYYKTNPGKHLGWYKGVGNPHKYGGNPNKGKKHS
jgi:hypothetical protein